MAEPPDAHVRRLLVSAWSAFGWLRIAAYIVGTPWKIVTWSRPSTSMALAGSKRGMSVRVQPRWTEVLSPQVRPKTWKRGRQPMMTSSSVISMMSAAERSALRWRLKCVSSAPLGLPVVPLV